MATNPSSDKRAHHQLLSIVAEELRIERAIGELKKEAFDKLKKIGSKKRAIDKLKRRRTKLTSEIESAVADLERGEAGKNCCPREAGRAGAGPFVELEAVKAAANFKQTKLSTQQEEIISNTSTLLKNVEVGIST
ncbi:unnamed protein product [Calypogeia fissa]